MTEPTIHGFCDSCDKKYRVPSASKTYPCKACGGVVSVPVAPAAEAEAKPAAARRRLSERRPTEKKSPMVGILIAVFLGLGALGLGGFKLGMFSSVAGKEVDARLTQLDITKVTRALVDAWDEGSVSKLTAMHHPTGRGAFTERLKLLIANRGWEAGWPTIRGQMSDINEGTEEAPETATAAGVFGDSVVSTKWQYSQSTKRWFLYDFWVSPTPFDERVEQFRSAWKTSGTDSLRPFFRPEVADKMQALFDQQFAKAGWQATKPALGETTFNGVDAANMPAGSFFKIKVESIFEVDGGSLLLRWKFKQDHDQWYISGLKLP